MKTFFSILLLGFFLYSCDNNDSITSVQFEEYGESDFLGKWFDVNGCDALMETDSGLIVVEDREIIFTFNEDNTYDLQNKDVCLDVINGGSWTFKEQNNELVLNENSYSSDSLVFADGERTHVWEVLDLEGDTLQLNHTYMYIPDVGEEFMFTFFREFVRVE